MENADSDLTTPAAWDRFIHRMPADALARAREADDGGNPVGVTAMLKYAIGKSLFELGDAAQASQEIEPAVESVVSGRVVDAETRRAVLMSSALILAEVGDTDTALGHLGTLERECRGATLGRVHLQRAIVLQHAGRSNDALVALDESHHLLSVEGTDLDRLRVHLNRGVVRLQRGDFDGAEGDLMEGVQLARLLEMVVYEAQCVAGLGLLYGRSRRLIDSVRAFDRASELYLSAGQPARATTWMEIDRAEVMMNVGMTSDAVGAARRALAIARPSGNAALVGDALLMCARTELAAGRFRDVPGTAAEAAEVLERTGRLEMIPHAEAVLALASLRYASASQVSAAYQRSRDLMTRLAGQGWTDQADELAVGRIRTAWRTDTFAAVVDDLDSLRLRTFEDRRDRALVGWFVEAVARRLANDLDGSIEACRRGLGLLDEVVAEAPGLEERSAAMSLGADLSRLAIEVSIERDDVDTVFAAAEGTRARALHDELHDQHRHRSLTSDGAERLRREVVETLGDRVLVEWIMSSHRAVAVVVDRRGFRLVDVAAERDVRRACDRVIVSLDMATTDMDASSESATRAAQLLDDALVAPLGLGDATGVVMVPDGMLHDIPWAGLPSLAPRSVSVAPSAQVWIGADRRSSHSAETVSMLSGPEVEGAALDRESILHQYPAARVVEGTAATAEAALDLFGEYGLVHVAAHGRFRSDRPLLSTLSLHGGDATLYDAVPERVGAQLIVLSSCEGGAQGTADGSEVLGLSAVLLARGAATVVAPLTAVRDLECAEFVAEVHAELASGVPVGRALADVRSRWLADDDLSRWAVASSFLCFGSGATRVQVASDAT